MALTVYESCDYIIGKFCPANSMWIYKVSDMFSSILHALHNIMMIFLQKEKVDKVGNFFPVGLQVSEFSAAK